MKRIYSKPFAQTEEHLNWFRQHEITHIDIGLLSRETNKMQNKLNIPTADALRIINYAKFKNVKKQTDILIRPHRDGIWPMLFVDDVSIMNTKRFCSQYSCLVVNTSKEGGCQMWIPSKTPLMPSDRLKKQRVLVKLLNADPGSVSGEHYGRLSGFTNHKRGRQWCNLFAIKDGDLWSLEDRLPPTHKKLTKVILSSDCSESANEYGYACHSLRYGLSEDDIINNIVQRALNRGKRHANSYAIRTVEKAKVEVLSEGQS